MPRNGIATISFNVIVTHIPSRKLYYHELEYEIRIGISRTPVSINPLEYTPEPDPNLKLFKRF